MGNSNSTQITEISNCDKFKNLVNENKKEFINEEVYRVNDEFFLSTDGFPIGRLENSPIWYSTREGIELYINPSMRGNSKPITFILNTNPTPNASKYFFIDLSDEENNLNYDLLNKFMDILNVRNAIKKQFENNQRKSDTDLDRELFQVFINKLESCNISDICGFYIGESLYNFPYAMFPDIFHPEYVIIANKQREILSSPGLNMNSIDIQFVEPTKTKKRKKTNDPNEPNEAKKNKKTKGGKKIIKNKRNTKKQKRNKKTNTKKQKRNKKKKKIK
jgi:hypothetical protein